MQITSFNFTLNLFGIIQSLIHPPIDPPICKSTPTFDLMSTKTSYELYADIDGLDDFDIPGCEPIGMWHLSRHGARYPDFEDIERINEVMPKLRDNIISRNNKWLCEEDKKHLQIWTSRMEPIFDNNLTPKGKSQQKGLGKRMQDRLPELMKTIGYPIQVDVKATSRFRTQQSANQYLNGFLDFLSMKPNVTVDNGDDYLLKFPDVCEKYLNEVKKNKTACQERDTFDRDSISFKNALTTFKQRINSSLNINNDELFELTLKVCQYEFLIDSTKSVWCKFFDDVIYKTLSYREDINYNCKYGYRYDISSLMTCDLNKNLVQSLERIKNGDLRKAYLLFGHSSTILPFYSTLEIADNDKNFNLDNILLENEDRDYFVSELDPMNSNIAFIVYKSFFEDPNNSSKFPKYYLRVFRNEKLIKIKACGYMRNCDLEIFLKYFQDLNKSCDSSQAVCKI